jgi:quercetin dioxygenase-like cupin family protein
MMRLLRELLLLAAALSVGSMVRAADRVEEVEEVVEPAAALTTAPAEPPAQTLPSPEVHRPADASWTAAPDAPALRTAWLMGRESEGGPYAVHFRLAQGGRVAVHAHPDQRLTTVLNGILYVGFGSIFDETRMLAVPAGAIFVVPSDQLHYLWAQDGDVEFQESGFGPSATELSPR